MQPVSSMWHMSCPCHQAISGQSFGLARLVAPLAACLDVMEGDRREQAGPCWALLGKSLPKRAWKSTADEAASLTPACTVSPTLQAKQLLGAVFNDLPACFPPVWAVGETVCIQLDWNSQLNRSLRVFRDMTC